MAPLTQGFVGIIVAAIALAFSAFYLQPSSQTAPSQVERRDEPKQPAPSKPAPPKKVNPVAGLRRQHSEKPNDSHVSAQLALALLEPVDGIAPNTDESSLYGGGLTIHHPNAAEARQLMERALKDAPRLATVQLAHQAVLMAEGRGEEAIQPGRQAVELAPEADKAAANIAWARSHLLAACSQGCAARESLRKEKREEKKVGRKSALEQREKSAEEDQARRKSQEEGGDGAPPKMTVDRGQLRAGAMWRIMEAGRLLGEASEKDPASAKRYAKIGKKLAKLNAHKVLNTEEVITHGECHHFFGQELWTSPTQSALCDMKRYKYE